MARPTTSVSSRRAAAVDRLSETKGPSSPITRLSPLRAHRTKASESVPLPPWPTVGPTRWSRRSTKKAATLSVAAEKRPAAGFRCLRARSAATPSPTRPTGPSGTRAAPPGPVSTWPAVTRNGGGSTNRSRRRRKGRPCPPRSAPYFSPDLSVGWNETITEPVLGPGGVAGYSNLYRRDNDTGSYEACTTAAPIEAEGVKYPPELEGVTPDQQHAVFKLRAKLTPEASKTVDQLYLCSFEPGGAAIDLVSVLPNGTASAALDNAVGTPTLAQNSVNRILSYSWLDNAISDDGSRVFWSLVTKAEVPEALYVRVNATQEQSSFSGGKCNKFFKACTYALSAPEAGRFWGATPSGSQALFAVEAGPQSGNLYLFDVAKAIAGEEPRTLIAGKTEGVLGVSEDLDRIYFASRETIGGEGTAGKPNLYLYEAGSTAFIGTLSEIDTNEKEIPSPVSTAPVFHLAHVTEDGGVLVFSSDSPSLAEETADYENTDLTSGEPASEIYRYQVGGGLTCLSCDPSGVRPSAARHIGTKNASKYLAAALPTWTSSLYPGNALSSDGSRLYFESFVPLALGDVNGMGDIYQWELSGTGGCDEASPTYVEASGGCLDLISSGQSAWDSKFMDASASGDDVFFTTAESLVSQDPGSIDAYDARVGGGFPPPPPPRPDCEGDCQTLTPPSA
ncbi:MAG: hypothetical protein E6G51_03505, partial [Actinobacteria bacterium]